VASLYNNLINRQGVAGRSVAGHTLQTETQRVENRLSEFLQRWTYDNNLINRYSVAGSTRTVARTIII